MAERVKGKLLEEEKLVDLVVGPDAYRDLPNLLEELGGDIRFLVCEQLVHVLSVHRLAFALTVRAVAAVFTTDAFIRADATPSERLDDVFFGARYEASLVGIFYAQ